ncbi:MAG: glycine C-acetyltransferase, partial [Candidatus Aminicenantes bacterium]|nr:glycine C-acetyltransferase [Candidatus Aminicenantes bacterium]
MYGKIKKNLTKEIQSIHDAGLYKSERIIMTPQGAEIKVKGGKEVLNFCANNYLGLSSHPKVIEAAHKTLDEWGYGMSSVRFICGTQDIHKILEQKISAFLQTEDTILYAACLDANGGAFEPLIGAEDAIITDQLNHASIIDGIRLCKAQRLIFKHADMADLEEKLKETRGARYRLVVTDGVFSMNGNIAKLDEICELADKYDAMVMIDDAHSTGVLGKTGRGTPEHRGVMGKIDIITGTLGKALGGASGGFISGRKELIELYRQRSRPYLFSNTLAPAVVGASIAVFDLLSETTELRDKLEDNTKYFREKMTEAGFDITPGVHPIVPIMLGKFENDAKLSQDMARDLLEDGI